MGMRRGWGVIMAARRDAVAPLAVRRVPVRQIAKLLEKQGMRNPTTGEPWNHVCIWDDVKALERQWLKQSSEKLAEGKAAALAQIREVQRQGWLAKDYRLVLQAVKQECELLGMDAPQKVDIEMRLREAARRMGMEEADAIAAAEEIVRASRS